jgi:hypothetical protein
MVNRIKDFYGKDFRIIKSPLITDTKRRRKSKEINSLKVPKFWHTPGPILWVLVTRKATKIKITHLDFLILQLIHNFSLLDEETRVIKCFYGGNKYIADFMGCSVSTVIRSIKRLEKTDHIVAHRKRKRNKFGQVITIRYICSKYMRKEADSPEETE